MNNNKQLIALDIGNVCVKLRYDQCLTALGYPQDIHIPLEFIEVINNYECGNITTKDWLQEFQKLTQFKFSDIELIKAYNLILGEENKNTREFVENTVATGGRVIFFSNISEIHAHCIFSNLSFAHLITGGIFSFNVGAQKPHKTMYESFEKQFGKPTLYLDDKAENLEAAVKFASWKVKQIGNL